MSKLWGVRHLRYFILKYQLLTWWEEYRGPGIHINESDWVYLDKVWHGEV